MRIINAFSAIVVSSLVFALTSQAQTAVYIQNVGARTQAFPSPINGGPDTVLGTGAIGFCRTDLSIDNQNRILYNYYLVNGTTTQCVVRISDNSLNVTTNTVMSPCSVSAELVASDIGGAFAFVRMDDPFTIHHTQNSGQTWQTYSLPVSPGYPISQGITDYSPVIRNRQLVADPNGNIYAVYFSRRFGGAIVDRMELNLFKITPTGQTSHHILTRPDTDQVESFIHAVSTDSHLAVVFSPHQKYIEPLFGLPTAVHGFLTVPWSAPNPSQSVAIDMIGQDPWAPTPQQLGIELMPVGLATDGGALYFIHRNGHSGLPLGHWAHKYAVKKLMLDANGYLINNGPAGYPGTGRLVDLAIVPGVDITNHLATFGFRQGGIYDRPIIDFTAARKYPPSYGTGGATAYILAKDNSGLGTPDYTNFYEVQTNGAMTSSVLQIKNDITTAQLQAPWTQEFLETNNSWNSVNGVRDGIFSSFYRRLFIPNRGAGTLSCLGDLTPG